MVSERKKSLRAPVPTLSVVIPCFRDAERLRVSLPYILGAVRALAVTFEILIADDGSNDRGATEAMAKSFGCRYIGARFNRGKGATVRRGMLAASGRFRVFTDSDAPYTAESLGAVVDLLRSGAADVVVGDRHLPDSRYYQKQSFLRVVASKAFLLFVRVLLGRDWKDTQCGLKGFRGDIVPELFGFQSIEGFAFDVEILYLATVAELKIGRVPVVFRGDAPSHVRLGRDFLAMMMDVVRLTGAHLSKSHRAVQAIVQARNPRGLASVTTLRRPQKRPAARKSPRANSR